MGSSEDEKSVKPEKASAPPPPPPPLPPDQSNIHVYSDWAAMQAYYGHRVAVPPYFNSGMSSGQAPHPYMWGPPQPMMPPYGMPYAALYAHGGVYAHPGVPLAANALSMDTPPKSPGTMDNGLMKKLKGFDGLAMSIGNGNRDSNDGTEPVLSLSGETEGSSDGSNGNSKGACQNGRKRSHEAKLHMIGEGKSDSQSNKISSGQENNPEKVIGASVGAVRIAGKEVGVVVSPSVTSSLELKHSPNANAKTSPASVQPTSIGTPNDSWLHNEREMKRERRKQSNRESARRSRLRKQAEAEELAIKVDSLTAENITLKSEINRLTENSENLKNENAKLMEFMKNAQSGQIEDATFQNCDEKKTPTLSTANLLSRVNNAGSVDGTEGEGEMYENSSKSGTKLHQLLDASPRTDAVAAG